MQHEDDWRPRAAAELEAVRQEAEELMERHHAELSDLCARLEDARRRAGLALEPGGVVELPADEPEAVGDEEEEEPWSLEPHGLLEARARLAGDWERANAAAARGERVHNWEKALEIREEMIDEGLDPYEVPK